MAESKDDKPRRPKNPKPPAKSYSPDPHRLLPHSEVAEKGVLGSILVDPRTAIGLCVEKRIGGEHFAIPAHATIYRELVKLWDKNDPIDFITFTQYMRDEGLLDAVGGAAYITELFTFIPTAANLTFYIEILEEKYTASEAIKVGTEFVGRFYDEQDDPFGLLDTFEAKVLAIRTMRKAVRPPLRSLVVEVITEIQEAYDGRGTSACSGLHTGFSELDTLIDGMHAEEMIVIAARPSHGKTAFAMNIAEHLAIEEGKPILVFSLEMSVKQLVKRLVLSRAKVNLARVRDGFLAERDFPAIQAAASEIANAPIIIEDTSGLSIQEARAMARRYRGEKGIEFIIGDYLQLFRSSTKRAQENRALEVAEISTGFKHMARELGIPVMVLSQLDRSVDKQKRKPTLADLRESGAIEQDADVVGMLRREEMYAEDDDEKHALAGLAYLDIKKQRNGPLGEIPLTFLKEFTRFETRATEIPASELVTQLELPGGGQ